MASIIHQEIKGNIRKRHSNVLQDVLDVPRNNGFGIDPRWFL